MTAAEGTQRQGDNWRRRPNGSALSRVLRSATQRLRRLLPQAQPPTPNPTPEELLLMRLEVLKGRGRTLIYLFQSCIAQFDIMLGLLPVERNLPQVNPLPAARRNVVRRRRYPRAGPTAARRSIPMALMLLLIAPLVVGGAIYAVIALYDSYVNDLVPPEQTAINVPYRGARIYDRNGNLLYQFIDDKNGTRLPVELGDVSDTFLAATIATEDRSFYTNPGVNVRGLARAAWRTSAPCLTSRCSKAPAAAR